MPGYQLSTAELDRLGIAFHEAAHAVSAVVLGNRVRKVVVNKDEPRTEYSLQVAGSAPAVTYAGSWAEMRWTMGRTPTPADMRRAFAKNSSDDQSLCAAGGPYQGAHVVPVLERCWPAVKELATTLYFKGTASHQDVCTALGLPAGDHGGPESLALAMIRAGGVPGSFTTTSLPR